MFLIALLNLKVIMSMEPSSTTLVDVSSIIVTSYAHPIIFALSLFSILWGGIAWVLVSQSLNTTRPSRGKRIQISNLILGVQS